MNRQILVLLVSGFTLLLSTVMLSCKDRTSDKPWPPNEPYKLPQPAFFPPIQQPEDNVATVYGVELGKMLFFEKALSIDSTISCASCHRPELSFAESSQFSTGVKGRIGIRNAPALVNLAWERRFFRDGRTSTLEEQSLHPITDPVEMNLSIEEAVRRLSGDQRYRQAFEKAFGTPGITKERIAKAIAQFERTLISYNSKYDKYKRGEYIPTEQEIRGEKLFFTHPVAGPALTLRGGNCGDCHLPITTGGSTFNFDGFHNNGTITSFEIGSADFGLEKFTGNSRDRGKFKTPNLRNIALTAPYMHNGSINSLAEVLDHYNHPELFTRPNVDILILEASNERFGTSLMLTPQEKADIIAFLHMLTDEEFLNNPHHLPPAR
jgi:cytochrome c peroxidase